VWCPKPSKGRTDRSPEARSSADLSEGEPESLDQSVLELTYFKGPATRPSRRT
jgi:hypothetical protein